MAKKSSAKPAEQLRTKSLVDEVLESRMQNPDHVSAQADGDNLADLVSHRAAVSADRIAVIRQRTANSADGHLTSAADIVLRAGVNTRMSEADYTAFTRTLQHATRELDLDDRLKAIESEYRSHIGEATVKEVDPYADGSPHSWVRDVLAERATTSMPSPYPTDGADRQDRLQRHGSIVVRALERGSKYGEAIKGQLAETNRPAHRSEDSLRREVAAEVRALTTGGGASASASGGGVAAFVTPAILLNAFAEYRTPFASFISQLDRTFDLPTYGLEVYVPQITAAAQVGTTTEGSSTAETDPTFGLIAQPVAERSGQITISQAVLDRVGPGIRGDQIMWRQLREQLDSSMDVYALTVALAGAQSQTDNAGSFTVAGTSGVGSNCFLNDLRLAKKLLANTAGVRLKGTHAFFPSDVIDYVLAWSDAQGRPISTPVFDDNRQAIKSVGDLQAEGYSGMVLSGLALFTDDQIPTTAGTSNIYQGVVCRPDTIYWMPGTPTFFTMPQTLGANLQPIVGVKGYAACVTKFATGVASISGTAYQPSHFA